MKTYSLHYKDCSNCILTKSETQKEKNEHFFEIIQTYDIVAIADVELEQYSSNPEISYDEDEYYSYMESVGNFYLCCFKNVSEDNSSEICNQCENPLSRFDLLLNHFENISDLLYEDKVYQLSQDQNDCNDCSKMGTTQCANFMFWIRDYLKQANKPSEQQVHLQIQRCCDYETQPDIEGPTTAEYESYYYSELYY